MAKALHGFDEEKRRNPLTIVEIIIIFVCAVLIVTMLCCYFLFSKTGAAPKIFGKMIYVTEATNMEPNIPAGSAVFASDENLNFLKTGDVVLFRTAGADNEQITGVLRIQGVETDESGKVFYTLRGDANAPTETIRLPKENILGQCKTYDEATGAIISFTTSTMGLLTVVIIPCILLIVFQIIRIVRIKSDYEYANNDDDDDDSFLYGTEDDDDDYIFNFDIKKDANGKATVTEKEIPAPAPVSEPVQEFAQGSSVETKEEEIYPQSARPVNKAYVDNDGAGQYHKNPTPTATTEDFRRSVRNDSSSDIPSFRKRTTRTTVRPATTSNFTADDLLASVEASQRNIDNSINSVYEEPVQRTQPVKQRGYEIPKLNDTPESPFNVYQRETEPVPPPAVENPVDITIPANAVMPEETIAPPPKKNTNKTVEELMRMIDEAN